MKYHDYMRLHRPTMDELEGMNYLTLQGTVLRHFDYWLSALEENSRLHARVVELLDDCQTLTLKNSVMRDGMIKLVDNFSEMKSENITAELMVLSEYLQHKP